MEAGYEGDEEALGANAVVDTIEPIQGGWLSREGECVGRSSVKAEIESAFG